MVFAIEKQMFLLGLVILFPLLCGSQSTFSSSRATYYGSPDYYGTPRGACGFGEYGRTVNDGNVAGVSRLYRNGTGCGACYQVRCTNPQYCRDDGVNMVVTDYGEGDRTDFILSPRAYTKLAKPNLASELFAYGVVDVEYRRIPCRYSGYNIRIRIHENSKYPQYLALVVLYVAGQNDVNGIELWQEDRKEWRAMRRAYGAVFDLAPAGGPISLRLLISAGGGYTWVQANDAIPSDWNAGAVYDTTVQLT
ncbi:expansin-like B1 [Ziziphus jujuba]|uniref:Expansin-like B1 n=2 Tax=Ziziphus jujuba TaxID=326968 RepID=A0A6P4B3U2_ZIZJJ|nr:expansin-like B1 [Ziziphus jujuba]KAH7514251.1 hypothetical protein FEM48_Zijuj11G0068900 [Ziziphus jujuba var. spinosa]